ncbi:MULTISPECIES: hypothetical protein [Pantoea]|nr:MULTISPECIES: hypothetical protein [Pantoea]WRH15752.1 hypothetical protein GC087_24450 [Pantoea sp. JZ2]
MKRNATTAILSFSVVIISGCTTGNGVATTTGSKSHNAQVSNYINDKSSLTYGNTIPGSGNICIDQFNFLKQSGSQKYSIYTQQYDRINSNFVFLNKNKNIMDKDAARMLAEALNMQLDSLCASVNFTGFQLVKRKIGDMVQGKHN